MKILVAGVIAALFFTSCTIREELHLEKDFTGDYQLSFEIKQAMGALKMMGADSIDHAFTEFEAKEGPIEGIPVDSIDGITSTELIVDAEEYTYGLKIGFEDVNAIHQAKNNSDDEILRIYSGEKDGAGAAYSMKKDELVFNYRLQNKEDLPDEWQGLIQIYNQTNFVFVITSEREIKSCSNKIFKISDDRKRAFLQISRPMIIEKQDSLKTVFKF